MTKEDIQKFLDNLAGKYQDPQYNELFVSAIWRCIAKNTSALATFARNLTSGKTLPTEGSGNSSSNN